MGGIISFVFQRHNYPTSYVVWCETGYLDLKAEYKFKISNKQE